MHTDTVTISTRIDLPMRDRLAEIARISDRTVSGEIRRALKLHLEAASHEKADLGRKRI